nr:amino acid permease [Terrilactibacillus tamarindi]
MISIGGVIGGGLFLGCGAAIHSGGPGTIITYLLVGTLVVFIMRMLGEMATVNPTSGSFSTYAEEEIGPWAGFTIGWLYWFFWASIIPVEAMMGASIVHQWFSALPIGVLSFAFIFLLTITNIFSVRMYGEFEYWLSIIKVVAISLFLVIGIGIILGLVPTFKSPGTANLFGHGGFIPNGLGPILLAITTILFSFPGSEIVTIAAAESPNPKKSVMFAINSVVWRILLFYLGSIAIIITVLPWSSSSILQSPFVIILDKVGIPGAATIMSFVILTAVLSCQNSGLYTASRMLYSLSKLGSAPKFLSEVNKKGTPVYAVIGSTIFSLVCAVLGFVSPDKLFVFLMNSSGAVMLLVYLVIAFSHLFMRRRLERENKDNLVVKMWLFPYLTYLTIASLIGILVYMGFVESTRSQVLLTSLVAIIIVGSYFIFKRNSVTTNLVEKDVSIK